MIGIVLDSVLMLLLVAALAYGVRLEKKLTALRAGQLAFAGAVTELNQAAGRAENALVSLRQSGEEADILHDRLMKAREVKTQLEMLIARAPVVRSPSPEVAKDDRASDQGGAVSQPATSRATIVPNFPTQASATPSPSSLGRTRGRETALPLVNAAPDPDDDRALRMAALAERIHGMANPTTAAPGRENVAAILGAMTANQAASRSLNQARRSLDEDLFAA